MNKLRWVFISLVGSLLALAASVSAAGGTGPGDALLPVGATQIVAAHSLLWYRFDYGGSRSQILATLDDNHAGGIRLAIYTPQEISDWQSGQGLHAIGFGSPIQGHDLGWAGQFPAGGTYFAVVYNDSVVNVSVSLRVTGDHVTTTIEQIATPTPLPNPFATVTPLGEGVSGKIAFIDAPGGNLYVMQGDGADLRRVSFGLDPQWNHAGTELALARQGPVAGIYTINGDGSSEQLRFAAPEVRAPDWNPDDSLVVFSSQTKIKASSQSCFGPFCFTRPGQKIWNLGQVRVADNSFKEVRSTDHSFTPTFNHEGEIIAYNDPSIGMMQTSLEGTYEPFPFIGDLRITSPGYNPLRIMSPQYSPDGQLVVYMVYQQPAWEIAVANADGSNQHLLTSIDPLDFVNPHNVSPVWSPDSKQILFLSNRNGKWEFFVMGADGSNQKQVLKDITDQHPITYEFESARVMSWSK